MSKITAYTAATEFDSNSDVLLKDGTNGTKKINVKNAAIDLAGRVHAHQRRNVYACRYLGANVTSEQLAAIADGTFNKFLIGDYWEINGNKYYIADMDYYYGRYDKVHSATVLDTDAVNVHHLVMIPAGIELQPLHILKGQGCTGKGIQLISVGEHLPDGAEPVCVGGCDQHALVCAEKRPHGVAQKQPDGQSGQAGGHCRQQGFGKWIFLFREPDLH